MKKLYIGTSGYNYRHWRKRFYPQELAQKNWLSFFASKFNTVEINATFYGSFKKKTFEKWRKQTPSGFCFTLKGPRYITHVKQLIDIEESIPRFFKEAGALKEKFGLTLWQFAPNFKNKVENKTKLERFLRLLPEEPTQVFEFRDDSWFDNGIFNLLDKYRAGLVINQSSKFPFLEKITGKAAYIRFHGPRVLYSSEYTLDELGEWAKKIRSYLKFYDVYCYFNNDNNAYAVKNALELSELVLGKKPAFPPAQILQSL